MFLRKFKLLFLSSFLLFLLFSCQNYKKIPYFRDIPDTSFAAVKPVEFVEPKIQYDDILGITVNTLDLQANVVNSPSGIGFNPNIAALSGSTPLVLSPSNNYRVDQSGQIEMAMIGKVSVAGYTTAQLRDSLQNKFSKYYKMPVVDVRFLNYRVSVLGEVLKPGTYTIPNEKINVLEAISLAGDLTIFGKRDNILLIRDSLGFKQMTRLNLNSKNLVQNPNFYLKQNDMLYVEPVKEKIANLDAVQLRYVSIASSVLSILIILATRVR